MQELVLEFRKISVDIEAFYQEKEKFLQTLKVSSLCLLHSMKRNIPNKLYFLGS